MSNEVTVGTRLRYNDEELALIKQVFAEQEELLVLVRRFLLQDKLRKDELTYLLSYINQPAIFSLIKKAVNPSLDKGAPAYQSVDLFSAIDITPTPADHAYLIVKARALANRFLNERFDELSGKTVKNAIQFDKLIEVEGKDKEDIFIDVLARNFLISHIDVQLFRQLLLIAGTKTETVEQQKDRLRKNSNK